MTESVTTLLEKGLERYNSGDSPEELIPLFKEISDRAPKNSTVWSCLAWLYLLTDQPDRALKAAQKSVKLDGRMPQARINLALAMLDSGEKGVRQHIDAAQQMIALDSEIRNDVKENIEDGLTRKPDWQSLERVKNWLFN